MKEQPLTPDTPAFKKCQNKIRLFLLATLALLFFFLPLSSTGKSLFLGLSTVFTLMLMYQRKKEALETIKHPLSILALTFLGWALIATLWSPAYSGEKLDLLKHYSKLLFIPLFLFAFRDEKSQKWSIHAFLLAMLVTFLISLLNISGLTHWYSLDPTAMFQNHIMTSFMMAIACFITATYAKKSEKHRWFYGTLAGLFAVHILFMNTGRMGYIIFFTLAFIFLIQQMNKKQRIIALILGIVASGFIVSQSKVIQNQIQITKHHLKAYERGKTFTSVGLRLQFYDFAQKAIAEKPFFGQGTGAYHHLFAHGGRFKPGSPGQDDPHNQYLFIWFEQGLVGLLIWLTFLAYAFWNARKLGENKTLMQGLLIAFALGSMTDSYLFRSGSGFLFCSLLAIFYAKKTTESSSSQIAKTR